MDRRLLSVDPITGLETYHNYNPQTDETIIETWQDIEPVLEMNKKLKNDTDLTKRGIKEGFWKYASIPVIFQYKMLVNEGVDIYRREHGERLSKLLENPDYSHLKTTTKVHRFK